MKIKTAKFGEVDLPDKKLLCNNVILSGEFNPHNVRLWIVGNEYGALCGVWASCEQDALDEGLNAGLLDSFLVDIEDLEKMTEDEREELTPLGNAGEYCDLTYTWVEEVIQAEQPIKFFIDFARADGAGQTTLFK